MPLSKEVESHRRILIRGRTQSGVYFRKIMQAPMRKKDCRAKGGSKETHKMVVRICQDGDGVG